MSRDPDAFAEMVVLTVKAALAPVLERLAVYEAKAARADAIERTVTELRDRLVIAETKAAAIQIPDVTDIRDRMIEVETKTAEIRSRVVELESATTPTLEVKDDSALRDRLLSLELATTNAKERLGEFQMAIQKSEAQRERLIERLAVVETKAPVPGPAGPAGRDGTNGKDGADGMGFDDVAAEFDGDRTLTLKMTSGLRVKSWDFQLPYLKYQGVFTEGKSYVPGDAVTWGGSMWHCQAETSAKPGESKDWLLCVQRGREGKPGKDGKDLLPIPVVKAH